MERNARKIALVMDAAVRGRGGYGVGRLSELSGIPLRTLHNLCDGTTVPNLQQLLLILHAMSVDGAASAVQLASDLLALVGMEARPTPRLASDGTSPAALALRVPAAAGEVAAGVARALEDGSIDAFEAHGLVPAVRHARSELDRFDAALRAVETPQLSLVSR